MNEKNVETIYSQTGDSVEENIVEKIFEAIIDQRLPPGAKLSESSLCDAFGVGRMRVRRALLLLANHGVVETYSNRGAYVACPSAKQARDVFEARAAIEPNIARLAVKRATPEHIESLEKHLGQESIAHHEGYRRDSIRYSGAFHVMLAEIADNGVMLRTVKELITRSSLIIGIFGTSSVACCREADHAEILCALKSGDQDCASELMSAHLKQIQANVDLEAKPNTAIDLKNLFEKTAVSAKAAPNAR